MSVHTLCANRQARQGRKGFPGSWDLGAAVGPRASGLGPRNRAWPCRASAGT